MAQKVTKSDYVKAQGAARCVDERKDKEGELLGVQLPGGSEHVMDMLLVAITLSGESVSDEKLFDMTTEVYQSPAASKYHFKPGVHIDDEHGGLSVHQCSDRCFGCGYDKVRADVLKRMGVDVSYKPGERIEKARKLGWNVQVLTQDHVPTATAAINKVKGTTLKTADLLSPDRDQSFNYDLWVIEVLTPIFEEILVKHGYKKAATLLKENAEAWGEELYAQTLDILSNGALGKDTLIKVQ